MSYDYTTKKICTLTVTHTLYRNGTLRITACMGCIHLRMMYFKDADEANSWPLPCSQSILWQTDGYGMGAVDDHRIG